MITESSDEQNYSPYNVINLQYNKTLMNKARKFFGIIFYNM